MSENLTEQLDRGLATCMFSIQYDNSDPVYNTSTEQLMIFILPLKTTTRRIDIYNAVKTDGALAGTD